MDIQQFQQAYDSLAGWEKQDFLEKNSEQLLSDIGFNRPDLQEVYASTIVWWLIEYDMATADEILNATVDDLDELQEILSEDAAVEYEAQEEELLAEEEYYSRGRSTGYAGDDSPF